MTIACKRSISPYITLRITDRTFSKLKEKDRYYILSGKEEKKKQLLFQATVI